MVNLIKGGNTFTRGSGSIHTTYYEITKEECDRWMSMNNWQNKLEEDYEKNMSDAIRYGYGFYGCGLTKLDGKYYFTVKTGSSCD